MRFQNNGRRRGPLLATICRPRLLYNSRAVPGLNALISDMLKLFVSMALPSLAGGVLLGSYVVEEPRSAGFSFLPYVLPCMLLMFFAVALWTIADCHS